jgi:hypothetical protein
MAESPWLCSTEEQVEPVEEDFVSFDRYFSFLKWRAEWARTYEIPGGERLSFAEWAYHRKGVWQYFTPVEVEWACHQYNGQYYPDDN